MFISTDASDVLIEGAVTFISLFIFHGDEVYVVTTAGCNMHFVCLQR